MEREVRALAGLFTSEAKHQPLFFKGEFPIAKASAFDTW
jgi:hypothetical protein